MTYPKIIGLSGYAQSGKDTVAGILRDLYGYQQIAFADKLREAVSALNPIVSGGGFEDIDMRVSDVLAQEGYEVAKKRYEEYRRLLQAMGTEVGRKVFGENFWVDIAFNTAPVGRLLVVSDVRFPNEFEAVKERGGEVWRIRRSGVTAINAHPSETAIDGFPFDHQVLNDGTIRDLSKEVIRLLTPGSARISEAVLAGFQEGAHE